METALKITGVTKYFGHRRVLNNVSFSVNKGEVFGFLGPNGSGKTTTLKIVLGFLMAQAGEVEICGINVKDDYEKAMSMVGGIVENPEMYTNLSGRMNLKMYARIHGNISKERIEEVAEKVGMKNRLDDKMKKYSLGMKQRIGVAQAILHNPELLILDEPTNGLDPEGIKDLRDVLKQYAHEQNKAVVVSSHLLSEMELMCDRVCIIKEGVICGIYTIEQLHAMCDTETRYRLKTSAVDTALALLTENGYNVISHDAEQIVFECEDEKVSEATVMLVTGGVPLTEFAKVETSLEEAFLKITKGGDQIA